ncbi:MAG: 16S rRNA (guanine(527)-N(7))-methyltransferase RsmG [Clostridia bacterium]|nr:16S rRNA (guanine(527)-N(7))-methyltransferase RsmG [Clostridia bacterium]
MNFFNKIGINLNNNQIKIFENYYNFLIEYNKKTNLTAITNKNEIFIKHFIDSLTVSKFIKNSCKLIDIGTGAGFPGVPLKILNSNINLTLLESSKKKCEFLKELSGILKINFDIINNRAEILSKDLNYREKFDICVSRAVANLRILSELCIPFIKINGIFIAMKGPNFEIELKNSVNIIQKLGCKIKNIEKIILPYNFGTRYLIIIQKIKNTPKIYPRSFSQIKRILD